jgi:hypothetical protein
MRTYLPVFVITLLVAWAFLGWFGDYNEYVGGVANDGRVWVKGTCTTADRLFLSFVLALIFAAIETVILRLWNKLRG